MSKKLSQSSTNIKALGFETIWSGAAYDKQKESYEDVIMKLDKCIEEVETFDNASVKLEEYKSICERIQTLYGYISFCSSNHTKEQKEQGCSYCGNCSNEISQKEAVRTTLRSEIKELLGKIISIDVELEGPTTFNPEVVEEPKTPEPPDLLPNYDSLAIINPNYDGLLLTPSKGRNDNGPQGCETWYDLDMDFVVERMDTVYGLPIETWIDPNTGVKMCTPVGGDGTAYVMVAADAESVWGEGNDINPNSTYHMGDIVQTSWGPGMVVDYCGLAVEKRKNGQENHFDIATAWGTGSYREAGQQYADNINKEYLEQNKEE